MADLQPIRVSWEVVADGLLSGLKAGEAAIQQAATTASGQVVNASATMQKAMVTGTQETTEAINKSVESRGDALKETAKVMEKDVPAAAKKMSEAINDAVKRGLSSVQQFGDGFKKVRGELLAVQAAFTALVGAAVYGAAEVDDAYAIIRRGTGATGQDFEDMKAIFRDIASSADESFTDIAGAITDLNTRLGLSGDALREATVMMLDFTEVNSVDMKTALSSVAQLLNAYGMSAEQLPEILDKLTVAQQKTGINTTELSQNLIQARLQMESLGFTFDQTIALFGLFEKVGIKPTQAIMSFNNALATLAQRGVKDPEAAFKSLVENIKNAETSMEAMAMASELFGKKFGGKFTDIIRSGALETGDLIDALNKSGGALRATEADSKTFKDRMSELSNSMKIAAASIGEELLPSIEAMAEALRKVVAGFKDLPGWLKQAIAGFGALGFAATAVVLVLGQIALSINALVASGAIAWAMQFAGQLIAIGNTSAATVIGNLATRIWGLVPAFTAASASAVAFNALSFTAITGSVWMLYEALVGVSDLLDAINAEGAAKVKAAGDAVSVYSAGANAIQQLRVQLQRAKIDRDKLLSGDKGELAKALKAGIDPTLFARASAAMKDMRGQQELGIAEANRLAKAYSAVGAAIRRKTSATDAATKADGDYQAAAKGASDETEALKEAADRARESLTALAESVKAIGAIAVESGKRTAAAFKVGPVTSAIREIAAAQDELEESSRKALESYAALQAAYEAQSPGKETVSAAQLAQARSLAEQVPGATEAASRQLMQESIVRINAETEARISALREQSAALSLATSRQGEYLAAVKMAALGDEFGASIETLRIAHDAERAERAAATDKNIAEFQREVDQLVAIRSTVEADMKAGIAPTVDLAAVNASISDYTKAMEQARAAARAAEAQADAKYDEERTQIEVKAIIDRENRKTAAALEVIEARKAIELAAIQELEAAAASEVEQAGVAAKRAEIERQYAVDRVQIERAAQASMREAGSGIVDFDRRTADERKRLIESVVDAERAAATARFDLVKANAAAIIASTRQIQEAESARLESMAQASRAAVAEQERIGRVSLAGISPYESNLMLQPTINPPQTREQEEALDALTRKAKAAMDEVEIAGRSREMLVERLTEINAAMAQADIEKSAELAQEKASLEKQVTDAKIREGDAQIAYEQAKADQEVEILAQRNERILQTAQAVGQLFQITFAQIDEGQIRIGNLSDQASSITQQLAENFQQGFVQRLNDMVQTFATNFVTVIATSATAAATAGTTAAGVFSAAWATAITTVKAMVPELLAVMVVMKGLQYLSEKIFGKKKQEPSVFAESRSVETGTGAAVYAPVVSERPQSIAEFARQANSVVQLFNISVKQDIQQDYTVEGVAQLQSATRQSILDLVPDFVKAVKQQVFADMALQNITVGVR